MDTTDDPTPSDAFRSAVAAKVEELTPPSAPTRLLSKSLVVTVALFVGLGLLIPWMREILVYLVPVLLIHELGHFIAMRLLGYRDVRMFFIPLLGAAVSGRHFNEPGWKAAVVALAGPLPGIALGVGGMAWCLFVSGPPPEWVVEAFRVLIILNCGQLLPIMPLDGGRVVRAVIASRLPWLDFWIFLLSSATLLAGSLLVPWRPDWLLLVIGVVVALPLPWLYGRDRLTARLLREGYRPVSGADDRISQADLDHLVDRIGEMAPNLASLANPAKVAEMAVEQYERLNHRPPGLAMSAVFLLAQFGAILLAIVSLVVWTSAGTQRPVPSGVHSVSFSSDGRTLASGSVDNTIRLWDAATGQQSGDPIESEPGGTWKLGFDSAGDTLVEWGWESIRLWRSGPQRERNMALRERLNQVSTVAAMLADRIATIGSSRSEVEAFAEEVRADPRFAGDLHIPALLVVGGVDRARSGPRDP